MKKHFAIIVIAWTLLIAGLIVRNFADERANIEEQARIEARAIWDHNLSYRKWVTAMGGVYVRRNNMAPNPYLKVPDRDKKTVDGISLTMANPAYMTSQVFDIVGKESPLPIINRIVSDKYLNPHNKPDTWEEAGLRAFNNGTKEVSEVTNLNGQPYLRLFKPMVTVAGCLKCHGRQGYKVGDIRGGISVAVPMKRYYGIETRGRKAVLIALVPLWLLGVGASSLYFRGLTRSRALQQESEERLSLALEAGNQAWWEWDFRTGKTIYSPRFYRMLGYEPDAFPATYDEWKKRVHPEDLARTEEFMRKHLVEEKIDYRNLEMRMLTKDERWRWISGSGKIVERDAAGNPVRLVGTNLDIEDHKQAEVAQRLSEERYRKLFDGVPDALVIADIETGIICDANPGAERLLGRPRGELLGMHQSALHPARIVSRTKDSFRAHAAAAQQGAIAGPFDHVIVRADGSEVPVEVVTQPVTIAGKTMIQGVFRDITERKRSEQQLLRLNRELQAISDCNQVLIHATDEQTVLNEICRIVCDKAAYRMVWVGYTEQDDAKTIRPVAWAGAENGYLADARITWADDEQGRGPTGSAVRDGTSVCFQDFAADPDAVSWRECAVQRGYRSGIALPLKDEVRTFGVLTIYAAEPNAFNRDESRLLEELAGDLAFGIMAVRNRVERKEAEEALRMLNEELEQRVKDRTAELEAKNVELARANKLFVGRELRMAELKDRLRELEKRTQP